MLLFGLSTTQIGGAMLSAFDFIRRRLPVVFLFILTVFLFPLTVEARARARIEPKIPDIPGYQTLKCDFHMHTVFSDGKVWPTIRAEEAWREGLDVFSITDHIEYLPFKDNVKGDHNRSHELALPVAKELGLILIKGSEITKKVPPGHFNALFLKDSNPLDQEDYLDCIGAAIQQGAFVFWNHPPFRQKDNKSIWHPEHTTVYEKGWLHGIEVVNGNDYYPKAHRWCLEKKLTMLGTSDVHNPINLDYDPGQGDKRPMTLVFATEKTEEAIKEALFSRRTAVYAQDALYGEKRFLAPLFHASVEIVNPDITIRGTGGVSVQVRNRSDIPFRLVSGGDIEHLQIPRKLTLAPDATVILHVRGKSADTEGPRQVQLPYLVENLLLTPDEALQVSLSLKVTFIPVKKDKK